MNILLKTCHYSTDLLLSSFLPLTIYFRVYLSFPFGRFASDYSESCISCSVCYEHGKLTVPFLFVTVFKHEKRFTFFFFVLFSLLPSIRQTTTLLKKDLSSKSCYLGLYSFLLLFCGLSLVFQYLDVLCPKLEIMSHLRPLED